jgi:hypothetical protein
VRIDLHVHSNASDGTLAPAEVVAAAAAAGLDVVALTDHDSTRGWDEALAALPADLTLVRGAEISCATGGVGLHLLAYLFDPGFLPLLDEMERTRDDRIPRAREIVRRLASDGIAVTWEGVLAQVEPGGTVGRPHIADALVLADAAADRTDAFDRFLHNGSRYYVRHYAPDPVAIVRLVRSAGGVPVFAHPGAHRRGRIVGDDVIAAMAAAGLAGLEVDHPDHDAATRSRLRGIAGDLGLVVTGSSDFHGDGKPNRLGEETTDPEAYEALVSAAVALRPVSAAVGA